VGQEDEKRTYRQAEDKGKGKGKAKEWGEREGDENVRTGGTNIHSA